MKPHLSRVAQMELTHREQLGWALTRRGAQRALTRRQRDETGSTAGGIALPVVVVFFLLAAIDHQLGSHLVRDALMSLHDVLTRLFHWLGNGRPSLHWRTMVSHLDLWGLRLMVVLSAAYGVLCYLIFGPAWWTLFFLAPLAYDIYFEVLRHRLARQRREESWERAAASADPVRSLAVDTYVERLSLHEITDLAAWKAQGKPTDAPDAPPVVRGYHEVLYGDPPREA